MREEHIYNQSINRISALPSMRESPEYDITAIDDEYEKPLAKFNEQLLSSTPPEELSERNFAVK